MLLLIRFAAIKERRFLNRPPSQQPFPTAHYHTPVPANQDGLMAGTNLGESIAPKKFRSNSGGRFPGFDLAFALDCTRSTRMFFGPDENPRTILTRKFSDQFVGSVVICDTIGQVVGVANAKTAVGVLENANPIHIKMDLGGWIRVHHDRLISRFIGAPH